MGAAEDAEAGAVHRSLLTLDQGAKRFALPGKDGSDEAVVIHGPIVPCKLYHRRSVVVFVVVSVVVTVAGARIVVVPVVVVIVIVVPVVGAVVIVIVRRGARLRR